MRLLREVQVLALVLLLDGSCGASRHVRKCCPPGVFMVDEKCSENVTYEFSSVFSDTFGVPLTKYEVDIGEDCGGELLKFMLNRSVEIDRFDIVDSGDLYWTASKKHFSSEHYCLDIFNGDFAAFICEDDESDKVSLKTIGCPKFGTSLCVHPEEVLGISILIVVHLLFSLVSC